MLALEPFVTQLIRTPPSGSQLHSHLTLPPTLPPERDVPAHFPAWLHTLLKAQGITHLSQPQWQALQLLHQDHHVCLTLPTGSGRGVVRLLTLYQSIGVDRHGHVLAIFPQKQRELAQLGMAKTWNDHLAPEHRLAVAIYDGDTPGTERRVIKQAIPHLVLTTPEMLHAGILAYHSGWRALFQGLRYIVLADLHLCPGALLAHLGHLLRRLYRLAHHYGSHPQFLLTSTPLSNPHDVAQTLTGRACEVVSSDTERRQPQHRVLLETHTDLATIGSELLTQHRDAALPVLVLAPPGLRLPADSLEQGSGSGPPTSIILPHDTPTGVVRLHPVRSVISLGLPSALTYLHAYLDLLANGPQPSLGIFVLSGQTPLERYLLRRPAGFASSWLQSLVFAANNPQVIRQHLLCAAAELALVAGERYPGVPHLDQHLSQLAAAQELTHRATSRQWVAVQRQPHRRVQLRWYERPWTLINQQDAQYITRLSPMQAFHTCFEGAQYPHTDGSLFHVEGIDDTRRRIAVRPSHAAYYTRGRFRTAVSAKRLTAAVIKPPYRLTYGWLDHTESLWAYERLKAPTLTRQSLEILPERKHQSRSPALWLDFPDRSAAWIAHLQPALHTLVHAVMASLPLLLCYNPEDIRGGLYASAPTDKTDLKAIFVDTQAGGNGCSVAMYQRYEDALRLALDILLQCDCTHGCHRCIAALTCDTCEDSGELDRQAGIGLLQQMLGETVPVVAAVQHGHSHPHGPRRHLYLTLTTQKSAEDVGGWQHKHLLGLGLALTYDTQEQSYRVYTEETVDQLLTSLRQADLIIGFNTRDFDYQILQPYTDTALPTLPTCAMLDDVQHVLGYRLSFRHLVLETLGIERPDDSIDTLQWYRQGDMERLLQMCRRDIDLLRNLARHGCRTGSLQYRDRSGTCKPLPVSWQFAEDYA